METILEILGWPLGEALIDLISGLTSGTARRTDRRKVTTRGPCAYCRRKGFNLVTCRTCRAPHHRDCATLNRRCAVYGCGNRKFVVPAA